ncbi:FUSC family protein [Oxalobacteraceae bacterium CAVE-383]|nr:FUSC family protein [Oxalobacteraceae bacterium CAVE-383]
MLSMLHSFGELGATIQKELAPVPGRWTTLIRYLIASAIVIVVSMSLQVPFLALSLIAIFSTTLQNTFLTRLSGMLATLGLTLALACTLLLLRLTLDLPLLRILGSMLILLCAMYFLRTSKLGGMGFLVGLVVIYTQSAVDTISDPELLTRAVLYLWVAVAYPIAVNILVGQLLPASADAHLWKELHAQLEGIANRIKGVQTAFAGTEETFLRMHRQLSYALMSHPKLALLNARSKARVRLVERLLAATRQLPAGNSPRHTVEYQRHAPIVLAAIRDLQFRHVDEGAFEMPAAPPDYAAAAPAPLAAMHRAFLKLAQEELPREDAASPAAAAKAAVFGLNTNALKFALKVVLATQIGYLFLSAVQWPGIHTCMLTCIILALPGLGATTHKGVMRLTGAALGSIAALLATVFVIPHLDSITGLLLLSLAVIAVGAWIAAGSPLGDYVGFQMVFCFALALFGQFGPSVDLTEIRDRAVGIVIGVIISLAVYSKIWPEREAAQAPSAVAELLRALSRVAAACGPAGNGEHERAQAEAWSAIDRLRQLRNHLAFEPKGAGAETPDFPFDDLLACARLILLDFDWLAMLAGDEHNSDPVRLSAPAAAAGKAASERLRDMAEFAAAPPATPTTPPNFAANITPVLPADDIAAATFDSINRQLMQLQQCLSSKP